MISVLLSSHGFLPQCGKLFEALILYICNQGNDKVHVQDSSSDSYSAETDCLTSSSSTHLVDSRQLFIKTGKRDVYLSVKVFTGVSFATANSFSRSFSYGSQEDWRMRDVVVLLVDLSDRQSFEELKKQYSHLIALAFRVRKRCVTPDLFVLGVLPEGKQNASANESVIKAWCESKRDIYSISYFNCQTCLDSFASHLSSVIMDKVLAVSASNAEIGITPPPLPSSPVRPHHNRKQSALNADPQVPSHSNKLKRADKWSEESVRQGDQGSCDGASLDESEKKDAREALREQRRKAFEQAMLCALEADRSDYLTEAEDDDEDDERQTVCSNLSESPMARIKQPLTWSEKDVDQCGRDLSELIEQSFSKHQYEQSRSYRFQAEEETVGEEVVETPTTSPVARVSSSIALPTQPLEPPVSIGIAMEGRTMNTEKGRLRVLRNLANLSISAPLRSASGASTTPQASVTPSGPPSNTSDSSQSFFPPTPPGSPGGLLRTPRRMFQSMMNTSSESQSPSSHVDVRGKATSPVVDNTKCFWFSF
eukprot:gene1851-2024_t